MRSFLLWACAAIVAVTVFGMIGSALDRRSPEQIDRDACIMDKGHGKWRGSLGVTLEQFCTAEAAMSALYRDRKDHPERY